MKLHNIKRRQAMRSFGDKLTILGIVIGVVALLALIFFQVRPIKTVDIKVPVATDRSSYYPGQQVSGIFFGDVFYEGRVEVLRDVYCKNYKSVIKTNDGDSIFRGTSKPSHLDGTSREIGQLPDKIPVGSNCVIQFANTYHIGTPFGDRTITKTYYTQNFAIISYGRRLQLDCEAAGGKDCDKLNTGNSTANPDAPTNSDGQSSLNSTDEPLFQPETGDASVPLTKPSSASSSAYGGDLQGSSSAPQPTTPSPSQNPSSPTPVNPTPPIQDAPAEPIMPPDTCTLKLLSICLKL